MVRQDRFVFDLLFIGAVLSGAAALGYGSRPRPPRPEPPAAFRAATVRESVSGLDGTPAMRVSAPTRSSKPEQPLRAGVAPRANQKLTRPVVENDSWCGSGPRRPTLKAKAPRRRPVQREHG
jgi:hypothetical protein